MNRLYTVAVSMKIERPLRRQAENDFCTQAVILLKNSTGKHHLSIRITSKTSISLSVNIRAKGMLTWAANRLQSVLRRLDMHVHTRAQANPNTFAHTQTDGHGASSCSNYFHFQLWPFSLVFPEFRIINVAFSPENNKTLFLASDMYHACVQCN